MQLLNFLIMGGNEKNHMFLDLWPWSLRVNVGKQREAVLTKLTDLASLNKTVGPDQAKAPYDHRKGGQEGHLQLSSAWFFCAPAWPRAWPLDV